jgi:hypothetical protein
MMRGAVLHGPKDLRFEERERPAIIEPTDAVIFRRLSKNTNWLTVLKGCPLKMDDLPQRKRELPKRLKL